MTDQPLKRILIDPPDGSTILAARHLDATEGPVRVGATVDAATRSAITRVLDYVAKAHNAPPATEATDIETTARVFAALHRSAEETVTRVTGLYEQWVKAGAPPLGVPMSRWWDRRLIELHDAIRPAADESARTIPNNLPICELPHQTVAEEDACERERVTVVLPCNHAHLRQPHNPHPWEPQSGMPLVECAGYERVPAATEADRVRDTVSTLQATVNRVREAVAVDKPTLEWTPPPPGSTAEQLPETLLALIADRLPDYTSTACQTADTLACTATYRRHPLYDEIREHAERLHSRCRLNMKFTGQLCACGCHPAKEQP